MGRWTGEHGPDLPLNAFRKAPFKKNCPATLEGGKGSAPAPDPRMGEAAMEQVRLNREIYQNYVNNELPWLKDIANEALGIQRRSADASAALSDYQLDSMRRNDERYWDVAVPFESELLQDVRRFDSEGYKQGLIDQNVADVQQAFDNARSQAARGLTRMGVNPNSGKFAAMQNQTAVAQAAAMASAANKTRQAADQIGLSTKMQMYGGMRGLAGLGATNAQLGLGAMNTGLNAAQGMMGAGTGVVNTGFNAQNAMNAGVAQGLNAYGNYVGLQQNAVKINNDANPLGALLGAGAQLGATWLGRSASDRRLKDIIEIVGTDERTGLTLYKFRYKGGKRVFVGVMADEVERVRPDAVYEMPDGYLAVDYHALGMEMVELGGE